MLPRSRRRRSWPLAGTLVLALSLTVGSATPAAGNATATAGAVAPASAPPAAETVALVTGDRILVEQTADGRRAVTIEAADRPGQEPEFDTVGDGENLYVFPADVAGLLHDTLDQELFNVTKLIDYGYTDGVPVVVTGEPGGTPAVSSQAGGSLGLSATVELPSVDGYAATIAPSGDWWSTLTPAPAGARGTHGAQALGGVEKVWLDEPAEIALAESGPLVGAPQAWAAGFDGAGMTIAVLDTGIDDTHPDLAGKVVATENFTDDPDAGDEQGHGTHVAGIVAGTGAASDGAYTGVAPGADLLNGKVCDLGGICPTSGVIAGMEWAASRADVVNLSLGTRVGTDGTDPLSQAANALTSEHDTLFVAAAGNIGYQGDGTVGSPAAADAALAVGSVTKGELLAFNSSRGPRLGDMAVKPEITAPGVGIVSARGDGTGTGVPVDDFYTLTSGTSMAAPHVAGGGALLLQQDPSLSAGELRAALATTAVPAEDLEVYQQGGGRLDLPAALEAPVRANPAPLNLGSFDFPHDDTEPVEADVTYTNRTDEPLTLSLAVAAESRHGDPAPAEMLSVSPATLEVPARATATATVRLDVGHGGDGTYGGYLVAENGGEVVTRTPVGFHKEVELFEFTVQGIDRNGQPAHGSSRLHIRDAYHVDRFSVTLFSFEDGEATVEMPAGTYFVMANIRSYDGNDATAQDRSYLAVPTLEVSGDSALVLDAREANEVVVDTPAHPDASPYGQRGRVVVSFEAEESGDFFLSSTTEWSDTYLLETDPATVGRFELVTNLRLAAPQLSLEVVDPVASELFTRRLTGPPPLDDDRELPLVFAGEGAEADYAGLDVAGRAVLTERDGPALADKEAVAREQGAAALLVMNNATGWFSGSVGDDAELPSMAISGENGELLRDLLAEGEVSVQVAGTPFSPYLYDVVFPESGRVPGDLHYVAEPERLATLHNAIHGVPGHSVGEYRVMWEPWQSTSVAVRTETPAGVDRIEYVTPGDTVYRQHIAAMYQSVGDLRERVTSYQVGEHREQTWFHGPLRPSVLEPYGPLNPGDPVTRTGDDILVALPEWSDSNVPAHHGGPSGSVDSTAFRAYRDGELLGEAPRPRATVRVGPDPAAYRFEVDVARDAPWWPTSTAVHTAWTFTSAAPPEEETVTLPILLVDYDTELDLTNTAPHPRDRRGPNTVDLTVRHQTGAEEAPITDTRLWVSYDDGDTWQERPVLDRGDGQYTSILPDPDPEDTPTGYVSLRVDAQDEDGNRIEQEVTRAWRLADR